MQMPEAPMHKNCLAAGSKNEIGFARKALGVEPEAIAHAVRERPDQHLRLHAFALDAPHIGRAPFGRQLIHVI